MSLIKSLLNKTGGDLFYSEKSNVLYNLNGSMQDVPFARELIEQHFDGETIEYRHHTGNPELAIDRTVDGKTFVDDYFDGSYFKALSWIRDEETRI